jgi:hypothetical protein
MKSIGEVMDHSFAIDNYTAERYVLGELNEAERDAYEEHYFSCPVCADEIKSATEFIETARHVVQNELKAHIYKHAARRSIYGSWLKNWRIMLQPFPAAACLLLIAVSGFTGYQNGVTIPQLGQRARVHVIPQNPTLVPLTESRGDASDRGKFSNSQTLILRFEIPKPASRADILTSSGAREYSIDLSTQNPQELVNVVLDAGSLPPGKYFVVVQGADGAAPGSEVKGEISRFTFEIVK